MNCTSLCRHNKNTPVVDNITIGGAQVRFFIVLPTVQHLLTTRRCRNLQVPQRPAQTRSHKISRFYVKRSNNEEKKKDIQFWMSFSNRSSLRRVPAAPQRSKQSGELFAARITKEDKGRRQGKTREDKGTVLPKTRGRFSCLTAVSYFSRRSPSLIVFILSAKAGALRRYASGISIA